MGFANWVSQVDCKWTTVVPQPNGLKRWNWVRPTGLARVPSSKVDVQGKRLVPHVRPEFRQITVYAGWLSPRWFGVKWPIQFEPKVGPG